MNWLVLDNHMSQTYGFRTLPHLSTEPPGSAQVKGRQIAEKNAQLIPTTDYG